MVHRLTQTEMLCPFHNNAQRLGSNWKPDRTGKSSENEHSAIKGNIELNCEIVVESIESYIVHHSIGRGPTSNTLYMPMSQKLR